jgi:hypothetical protein
MHKKLEKSDPTNIAAIKIDYDRTLLMSVEDGLEFMKLVSRAELMKGYSDKREFFEHDSNITFSLISVQKVKEMKMANIIDPDKEKEDGS